MQMKQAPSEIAKSTSNLMAESASNHKQYATINVKPILRPRSAAKPHMRIEAEYTPAKPVSRLIGDHDFSAEDKNRRTRP